MIDDDDPEAPDPNEEDAILALIRCPSCNERAPQAKRSSVGRIAFEVASVFFAIAIIALIVGPLPLWGWMVWLVPVIGAIALAFAARAEVRRWRLAARARLVQLRPGTAPPQVAAPLPVAIAQPGVTGTRPRLAPIEAAPPAVVEPTDADEPPQILRHDRDER